MGGCMASSQWVTLTKYSTAPVGQRSRCESEVWGIHYRRRPPVLASLGGIDLQLEEKTSTKSLLTFKALIISVGQSSATEMFLGAIQHLTLRSSRRLQTRTAAE